VSPRAIGNLSQATVVSRFHIPVFDPVSVEHLLAALLPRGA
jgi:hypothetical protein